MCNIGETAPGSEVVRPSVVGCCGMDRVWPMPPGLWWLQW